MRTASIRVLVPHAGAAPVPSLLLAVLLLCGGARAQTTTRLSVRPGPVLGNEQSGGFLGFGISADDRYVVFSSEATNLVPGDTNGSLDIFVRDRQSNANERASVDSNGVQGNGFSYRPAISADGRYVVFESYATNLVAGDTNGHTDVFLHDRQTGATERVSVSSLGGQGDGDSHANSVSTFVSADGRYVSFYSNATNLVPGDANARTDVFIRDRLSGTTELVSSSSLGVQGNDDSDHPTLSADGRYVAFTSGASNLVPGDTNGTPDVFVRDRLSGTTERVSVDSAGVEGNGLCYSCSISADGRCVAFDSRASNLVPGDTNGAYDIFVHDRLGATTERVSVDSAGIQANGISSVPSISADGRYVAFDSGASNLVPGDTGWSDVFLHDRQIGTTVRVSVDSLGAQGNSNSFGPTVSGDGRFVVLSSYASNFVADDTNGFGDVFLHEIPTGATTLVSLESLGDLQGDLPSVGPAFSDGERYVAFSSGASNLVPGDVNGRSDVFVRDLQTGATTLASVSSSGAQGNQFSAVAQVSSDARYVAFFSISTTLVPGDSNGTGDVFVRDTVAGTTEFATLDSSGAQVAWAMASSSVSMSSDGRYVAFTASGPFVPADTNGTHDVYVRDRTAATTIRASVSSSGAQGDGGSFDGNLSADGRYAVFSSDSTNLVPGDTNGIGDVFVRDLVAGSTSRVSVATGGGQADGQCVTPSISPDGRYVAFWSDATNLVAGDTNGQFDVFVRDLQAGTTTRESLDSNDVPGNGMSYYPSISRGGRYVVFVSEATNLVQGDTNGVADVFLRDRLTRRTTRVSESTAGAQGDLASTPNTVPVVTADGRLVAFDSYATTLVAGDTNGYSDVFLRDRGEAAAFDPFCFGDGTLAPCPCGNSGSAGHGCQNSASTGGALLAGTGIPSLAADSVVLTCSGELPTSTSILLQGPTTIDPVRYGDGLRCAGGVLRRLYTHSAAAGTVVFPQGADLPISEQSTLRGDIIPAGSTRYYQVYYRDPVTTYCPSPTGNTFNVSNAVPIGWSP